MSQEQSSNKHWPQWLFTIFACIAMFNTGLVFTWTHPTIPILLSPESPLNVTVDDISWFGSLTSLGAAFGTFPSWFITRFFGPKLSIQISAILFTTSFATIISMHGIHWLYAARAIGGVAVGFCYTAVPIYISEISEKQIRGSLMVVFTLALGIGGLFMDIVGTFVSIQNMGKIMVMFPLLQLLLFSCATDSPYFHVKNNHNERAFKSLRQLRRQKDEQSIKQEITDISSSIDPERTFKNSIKEIFKKPNPKAFAIVMLTLVCQQTSGYVPTMLYQTEIYIEAAVPFSPNYAAILTSVITNVFVLFTMALVDKWGRKPLLYISSIGCIISNLITAAYFHTATPDYNLYELPIFAFNLLSVSYFIGLASIPYTIAGEIFSGDVREVEICLISTFGALIEFGMSKAFPLIMENYHPYYLFYGQAVFTAIFGLLIVVFLPETKMKSFTEIQELLTSRTTFISKNNPPTNGI